MTANTANTAHSSHARAAVRLVDAAYLAAWLNVDRDWVYAHAADLGALRLGAGPRARLRFDLEDVRRRLAACPDSRGSETAPTAVAKPFRRSGAAGRSGTDRELLPIRAPGRAS